MLACLSRLLWHFKVGEQRSGISASSSLSPSLSFFCELTPARIDSKNGALPIVEMFNVDIFRKWGWIGIVWDIEWVYRVDRIDKRRDSREMEPYWIDWIDCVTSVYTKIFEVFVYINYNWIGNNWIIIRNFSFRSLIYSKRIFYLFLYRNFDNFLLTIWIMNNL